MKRLLAAILVLALGAGLATAQEQLRVDLDMGSLPSSQGWIFASTDDDESLFFHADGTILYQDSTGAGWGLETGAYYYLRLAQYLGVPNWSLTVRARVLSSFPTEESNPLGFSFILGLNGTMGGFAITPGTIRLAGEAESRPFDGRSWHTYSVQASARSGTFSLYVDGVLLDTLPLASTHTNQVMIGDVTNSGWAQGEISHVTVVLSNSATVPNASESWGGVKALYR